MKLLLIYESNLKYCLPTIVKPGFTEQWDLFYYILYRNNYYLVDHGYPFNIKISIGKE
jgi:hypothetical protein